MEYFEYPFIRKLFFNLQNDSLNLKRISNIQQLLKDVKVFSSMFEYINIDRFIVK